MSDVSEDPRIDLLLARIDDLLGELKALDLKWQFEHELAESLQSEVEWQDREIERLRGVRSEAAL